MSISLPSAVPVLAHWEAYLASSPSPTLAGFATWLTTRLMPTDPEPGAAARQRAAAAVAIHAWRFARRLGAASRAHWAGMGLGSVDEFLLLYAACQVPAPGLSKTELYRYAVLRPTTGGQMLARLLGQGWLAEVADPADGRRTFVRPTPAGQVAFHRAAGGLDAAITGLAAPLADPSLYQLRSLLAQVDQSENAPPNERVKS